MSSQIGQVLVAAVLMAGGLGTAQSPEPVKAAEPEGGRPKLFCPNPVLDLGTIIQGEVASGSFTIQNRGDAVLELQRIKPSCGCTTVALSEEQKKIPPGGEVEIVAKFNSRGRHGKQKKFVTITSNDPANKNYRVTLECTVESLINVKPSGILNFRTARRGAAIEPAVEVTPGAGATTLTITSIQLKAAGIRYTQEPLTEDDDQGIRLRFAVDEDAPLGRINATATIRGKAGDRDATQTVRLVGEIIGELSYSPRMLTTARPAQRGQKLRVVRVKSNGDEPFEILGIDTGPNLVADVENKEVGTSYQLTLTVSEDASDGPFGTFVDIRTSVADQPLIRIPVFVNVAPAVRVSPPIVLLKTGGTPTAAVRKVGLSTSRGAPLTVAGATCDQSFVTAEVVDGVNKKGPKHYVQISVNGQVPPGTHEAVVTVQTDVRGAEQVRIPVTVIAGAAAAASGQ